MDSNTFRWVNRLADHTSWAHGLFAVYANYGIVLFAALLAVVFLDGRRRGDPVEMAASVWAAGAALVALGIGQLLGGVISRARPYEAMGGVHVLIARTTDFSFPSDHATAVGAVAAGLLLANRRWGSVAAVLAIVMAFARVYVGAHYPGDVLAGLALGGAVACAGRVVVMSWLPNVVTRLGRTRLRPLVTNGSLAVPQR